MKKSGYIVLALTGILVAAIAAQKSTVQETYSVRIIIEPRPDAQFYQIEWLETDKLNEHGEPPEGTWLREKITRTEIRRELPLRFRYFRLRSAYREGLYGPWGDIIEIRRPERHAQAKPPTTPQSGAALQGPASANTTDYGGKKNEEIAEPKSKNQAMPIIPQDVFAQVIDKDGREKWILRGQFLAADRLDRNRPLWYSVESLSDADAPENTRGRQRYEQPLAFMRPGKFRLDLFAGENPESPPIQTWVFWVYTDTPRSNAMFYAPLLQHRGRLVVGGKTKINLSAHFSGAVIDRIDYRIFADGQPPGAWQKYEDSIEVSSFAAGQQGMYHIEFRAVNVAGTEEPPQQRHFWVDAKGPTIHEQPGTDGRMQFTFSDEHYPIIVRVYVGQLLHEDFYFRQRKVDDVVVAPAASGYTIYAIDLLGNETILQK